MYHKVRPIIVLTPVRNETWILDVFLKSVNLFADKIIIFDQSDDNSTEQLCIKYNNGQSLIF